MSRRRTWRAARRRSPVRDLSRARSSDRSLVDRAIVRGHTRLPKLALDRLARGGARTPLLEQELDDGARERQRLLARDHRDVTAEEIVQLEPAWIVGGE